MMHEEKLKKELEEQDHAEKMRLELEKKHE